jgi:periplasmic divalent cation tolerance protein
MAGHYQVSLTAPSLDEAARLGRSAVENRLAACAQVFGPIASTYWWEGEVRSAEEWSCQLKTTRALLRRLTESLRAAHSYDVPEIVAVPIDDGDPAYLGWIEGETRSDP